MPGIAPFEEMSDLSARMLEAARANDWDRLAALEREMASLREGLQHRAESLRAGLSGEERQRVATLIGRMLEDGKAIRAEVEPWLDSVRALLSRGARERDLKNAYGAFLQTP